MRSSSYAQRILLAVGLLLTAAATVYVPYEVERLREGDNWFGDAGYAFIWSPPDLTNACAAAFALRESPELQRKCRIRPALSRAVLTAGAIALVTGSLWLVLSLFRLRTGLMPSSSLSRGAIAFAAEEPEEAMQPIDRLFAEVRRQFPISGGTGRKENPFVVTASTGYVAVEYAVVEHLMAAVRREVKLKKQELHDLRGRRVDELTYDATPIDGGSAEQVSYYFDITIGYRQSEQGGGLLGRFLK